MLIASVEECSFVKNVKKVILSKKCWFIDSFNADLLEEIIAPDDNNEVTSIDGILYNKDLTTVNGFPRATKIEKVVFEGTEPPAMLSTYTCFTECSSDIKFYVPKGCKQAYVDAWTDWYANAGYAGDLADRIVESD